MAQRRRRATRFARRRAALIALIASVSGACSLLHPLDDYASGAGEEDASAPRDVARVESSVEASVDGGSSDDASSSRYASEVLADSPVVYLRFEELAAATTVREEAAGRDLTVPVTGVTLGTVGAVGRCATFDGTGGIELPPGQDFEGSVPFTVEAWVRRAGSGVGRIGFVVDHEAAGRRGWSMLVTTSGALNFERRNDAGASTVGKSIPLDEWHHVAGVFDGEDARLFVDGELESTFTGARPIPALDASYAVGRQICCTSGSFRGELDELAIYDKALSVSRLRAHLAAR